MKPEDKEYVRLIAREAAEEAIRHMTTNGFMPMLREEARKVAEKHVGDHAETCALSVEVDRKLARIENKMAWGVVKAISAILLASGGGGGVALVVDKLFLK